LSGTVRRAFPLLIILILLPAWAAPVSAHAELIRSVPAANGSVPAAPAQVELFFTEAVEPSFSTIEVLNTAGERVDNNDSRLDAADPTHLTVSLRSLPVGVYTVSWKVLSEVDGHVTSGAFPFAVGDVEAAALAEAAQAAQQVDVSTITVVARWLTYLAAAVLTGGSLFLWRIWQPTYETADEEAGKLALAELPWRKLAIIALSLLAFAQLLWLLAQAGQAADAALVAPWQPAVANLLFTTRFGVFWLARFVLLLLLMPLLTGWASRRINASQRNGLILLGAALLLLTISLGSHAAADREPLLPVAADWLHLLATSVWVGGLVYFAAGLWATRSLGAAWRTRLAARLLPRFTPLAMSSVGLLLLTGLYAAVLRLGSLNELTTTAYGLALLLKIILALVMVALGAVNFVALTGRLEEAVGGKGNGRLADRFRAIVSGEMILGVIVLLLAGVLTSLPPSRTIAGLAETAEADDLQMELLIAPGRVGLNTFRLRLTANDRPVDDAREVALRFTALSGDVPVSEATLTAEGNGEYSVQGGYLSLPRAWQVQAVVRREGAFDAFANFDFDLTAAAAEASPRTVAWNRPAGILLLLAGLVFLAALAGLRLNQRQYAAIGVLPALALFGLGLAVLLQPPAGDDPATAANPIPPNAVSLANGEAIYTEQCLPCHGATGKGDGPIGLTLNPPPADLSLHAVPGVHPDRQLFDWISQGFPGSVMPAFANRLDETERWHVVNYVRTLAQYADPAATAPAVPLPATATPTTAGEAQPTPAWGHLGLSGRLLFLSYDEQGAVRLSQLELASGVQSTIFEPSRRAYLVGFAVSPDNQQIVLSYSPPPAEGQPPAGYNSLYLMPLNGSTPPEHLAGDPVGEALFAPVWSADGEWLYYAVYRRLPDDTAVPFRYDVERLATAGGEREVIVESGFWPSLSADGARMAFLSFDPNSADNELQLASAEGGDTAPVLAPGTFPAVDAHFFSPDGEWLYFSAINELPPPEGLSWLDELFGTGTAEGHSVPSDWWRLPLAGGEPERLTFLGDTNLIADFSPDGRHIAFMGSSGLYVMEPDGSGLTQLTAVPPFGALQWIP
jgi:copper transport protein